MSVENPDFSKSSDNEQEKELSNNIGEAKDFEDLLRILNSKEKVGKHEASDMANGVEGLRSSIENAVSSSPLESDQDMEDLLKWYDDSIQDNCAKLTRSEDLRVTAYHLSGEYLLKKLGERIPQQDDKRHVKVITWLMKKLDIK